MPRPDLKAFNRDLEAQGFTIETTNANHHVYTHGELMGGAKVFGGTTPSDRRATRNLRAKIRRTIRQHQTELEPELDEAMPEPDTKPNGVASLEQMARATIESRIEEIKELIMMDEHKPDWTTNHGRALQHYLNNSSPQYQPGLKDELIALASQDVLQYWPSLFLPLPKETLMVKHTRPTPAPAPEPEPQATPAQATPKGVEIEIGNATVSIVGDCRLKIVDGNLVISP
jgi:hypothetical protein